MLTPHRELTTHGELREGIRYNNSRVNGGVSVIFFKANFPNKSYSKIRRESFNDNEANDGAVASENQGKEEEIEEED